MNFSLGKIQLINNLLARITRTSHLPTPKWNSGREERRR